MVGICSLVLSDPITRLEHELAEERIRKKCGRFLPAECSPMALKPFVDEAPWRYWDEEVVQEALGILEADKDRSRAAMTFRSGAVGRGVDNLFGSFAVPQEDDTLFGVSVNAALIRLMSEYLPEYLRLVEHVYGNLLQVFWTVATRGGLNRQFDLRGAVDHLSRKGHGRLSTGYSDNVRNGLAHGEVRFTGSEIEFGHNHPERLSPSEFLRLSDEMFRTSNALGVAIILFWLRDLMTSGSKRDLPLAVITRIASGAVNRSGFTLVGTVESEYPSVGKQLHAVIKTEERGRTQTLLQCARVASHLILAGATFYDRMLFEVDHGRKPLSLVIIRPAVLHKMLVDDVPCEGISEIFEGTQLLFHDEGKWKFRLRLWKTILEVAILRFKDQYIQRQQSLGRLIGKNRYRVRKIQDISYGGTARVKILASLLYPEDALSTHMINEIVRDVVGVGRNHWVGTRPWDTKWGPMIPRKPVHAIVTLCRMDGPIRWLESSGWAGGNLVCIAEKTWRDRKPIHVVNPEASYKGIRMRYRMDAVAAKAALEDATALVEGIVKERQEGRNKNSSSCKIVEASDSLNKSP